MIYDDNRKAGRLRKSNQKRGKQHEISNSIPDGDEETQGNRPLPLRGYEDLVGQVLAILCENAVKYADDGGTVEIAVHRARKEIVCTVRNTGEGIPSKDLPYVFDRFYRADATRTAEAGYGLGLSIAKGITEQIGGRLSVRSKDGLTEFVFGFEG